MGSYRNFRVVKIHVQFIVVTTNIHPPENWVESAMNLHVYSKVEGKFEE